MKQVAAAHNVSTAQVALRWVAQLPAVFVTSADDVNYIKEDLDIYGFSLTPSEMLALAEI